MNKRWVASCLSVVFLSIGMAACGSSSSTSNSASSGGASSSSSTSGSGSTSSASGSSGSSSSSAQAQAQKLVAQDSAVPTQIPENRPINKPIPKNKTIAWLDCGVPTCLAYATYIKQATDALGWHLNVFHGGATPQAIDNAMTQLVASKPDGVIAISTPRSLLDPYFKQLQARNVPVVMCCILDKPGGALIKVVGGADHARLSGRHAADFVVADKGTKANVVWLTTKDFAILQPYKEGMQDELKRLCSSCGFDEIDISSADIGKPSVASTVVSYLQSHPNVNYVAVAFDDLGIGVDAAIKAAGLQDRVSMVGTSANPLSLAAVKRQDVWKATELFMNEFGVWGVDMIIRHMLDLPQSNRTLTDEYLVTKTNVPSNLQYPPVVPDFLAQFKKLWGIS